MTTTTNPIGAAQFRRRDLIIVALTTFVMAGVVAVLFIHLHWFANASSSPFGDSLAAAGAECEEADRPALPKPARSRPLPGSPQAPSREMDAEAQEGPAPAKLPGPAPPQASKPDQGDFLVRTILIGALVLVIGVVSPGVFAYCFFRLLRRHTERFGALIQINQAAAPAVLDPSRRSAATRPARRSADRAPRQSSQVDVADDAIEAAPGAMADQPPRKGDRLFDRLFEETLELQEQIDAIEAPTLSVAG